MTRSWVLHLDLDEFIAAVEVLRHPELAGRPVVVGGRGDPTERAVVSTASYEARRYGISSGMPLRTAARLAPPDAVFLPVDTTTYAAASATVMDTLRSIDGLVVEVLGWDEAFLGVETPEPEEVARHIQRTVLAATGLHCSVGIGDTTTRAKVATGFAKPRGVFRLTRQNWLDVMGDRATDALWGIGAKTRHKLEALGIRTVTELSMADPDMLARAFGPRMGPHYRSLGRGQGRATVTAEPWTARSHSRETTFQTDLTRWDEVTAAVRDLARTVAQDLAREARPAVRVALKVRYAPFETHTTSRALDEPTTRADAIADAAAALVDRLDHTRAVRLVGVRAEMAPRADPA